MDLTAIPDCPDGPNCNPECPDGPNCKPNCPGPDCNKCPPNYCDLAINYDQFDCELDCHPTQTTTTESPWETTTTTKRPCHPYCSTECPDGPNCNPNCPGPDCPDCPPNFCDLAVNYDLDCNLVCE